MSSAASTRLGIAARDADRTATRPCAEPNASRISVIGGVHERHRGEEHGGAIASEIDHHLAPVEPVAECPANGPTGSRRPRTSAAARPTAIVAECVLSHTVKSARCTRRRLRSRRSGGRRPDCGRWTCGERLMKRLLRCGVRAGRTELAGDGTRWCASDRAGDGLVTDQPLHDRAESSTRVRPRIYDGNEIARRRLASIVRRDDRSMHDCVQHLAGTSVSTVRHISASPRFGPAAHVHRRDVDAVLAEDRPDLADDARAGPRSVKNTMCPAGAISMSKSSTCDHALVRPLADERPRHGRPAPRRSRRAARSGSRSPATTVERISLTVSPRSRASIGAFTNDTGSCTDRPRMPLSDGERQHARVGLGDAPQVRRHDRAHAAARRARPSSAPELFGQRHERVERSPPPRRPRTRSRRTARTRP